MEKAYLYLYGATLLVLALEIVAGRHKNIYRRGDFLVIGLCFVISRALKPIYALALGSAIAFALPRWKGMLADLPVLPAYLGLLTLVEFAFYGFHRLAHEGQRRPAWAWLWKLHRTHHAGRYLNVLVTVRIIPWWAFVVPTTWLLGIAVYLGQSKAAALTILTIYGWNLITHSNFRWDDPIRRSRLFGRAFRALEHVLVSPGIHHTHHGYGRDGKMFRNYAVTFAFIDWMFGTLHIPEGRPAKYGVPGEDPHWAEEIFYPFIRIPVKSTAKIQTK
jgi:sterol desaturase/sphingolipid hydroxylase (fatty acid hydroxylase superfamily)